MTDTSLFGVLRLLDLSPRRSQREVARELGVSVGKANYLFQALLSKGYVKMQNFRRSPNKRGYAYLLTPEGVIAKAELAKQFLDRKVEEYEVLRREIDRLRAEVESSVER